MSEEKKKKGGFFKRLLGMKSKEERVAEEAAKRAQEQKQLDEQMAARMAAINAAALKSAREQDERVSGAVLSEAEKAEREAEEKQKAEAQARKDVEAAKRLAAEQREQEKAAQEKAAAQNAVSAKDQAQGKKAQDKKAKNKKLKDKKIEDKKTEMKKAEEKPAPISKSTSKAEPKPDSKANTAVQPTLKSDPASDTKSPPTPDDAQALKVGDMKAAVSVPQDKPVDTKTDKSESALSEMPDFERASSETEKPGKGEAEADRDRPVTIEEVAPKSGFFSRITRGLRKSTSRMSENVSALFNKRRLDDEALEDLEDLLIASDLGVGPASQVTARLAKDKFDSQITDMEIKVALADVISNILTPLEKPLILSEARPQILLFVGVNGSGKTTTLGKMAKRYYDQGHKVLIVAGDTFRAAAVEQLTVWSERAGATIMSGTLGADAAGLVYDAIDRARRENFDIVMIDTAGRLQNRTELMEELAKIVRVIKKQDASAPHHSILVLDATVGQNALLQTEAFKETAGVTGLVMTKLDGTAKGGVLVALSDKYKLPIHAIGIGERLEDLENFSAPVFAAALSGVADAVMDTT